jgi:hypothetical protein
MCVADQGDWPSTTTRFGGLNVKPAFRIAGAHASFRQPRYCVKYARTFASEVASYDGSAHPGAGSFPTR